MGAVIPDRSRVRLACGTVTTSALDGEGTLVLTLPGARWVEGGDGAFDAPLAGDKIKSIEILDSSDVIVENIHDAALAAANQGAYILAADGKFNLRPMSAPSRVPNGYKIRIVVKKGQNVADVFRFNLRWGA